jgi:hypothetical protein
MRVASRASSPSGWTVPTSPVPATAPGSSPSTAGRSASSSPAGRRPIGDVPKASSSPGSAPRERSSRPEVRHSCTPRASAIPFGHSSRGSFFRRPGRGSASVASRRGSRRPSPSTRPATDLCATRFSRKSGEREARASLSPRSRSALRPPRARPCRPTRPRPLAVDPLHRHPYDHTPRARLASDSAARS